MDDINDLLGPVIISVADLQRERDLAHSAQVDTNQAWRNIKLQHDRLTDAIRSANHRIPWLASQIEEERAHGKFPEKLQLLTSEHDELKRKLPAMWAEHTSLASKMRPAEFAYEKAHRVLVAKEALLLQSVADAERAPRKTKIAALLKTSKNSCAELRRMEALAEKPKRDQFALTDRAQTLGREIEDLTNQAVEAAKKKALGQPHREPPSQPKIEELKITLRGTEAAAASFATAISNADQAVVRARNQHDDDVVAFASASEADAKAEVLALLAQLALPLARGVAAVRLAEQHGRKTGSHAFAGGHRFNIFSGLVDALKSDSELERAVYWVRNTSSGDPATYIGFDEEFDRLSASVRTAPSTPVEGDAS